MRTIFVTALLFLIATCAKATEPRRLSYADVKDIAINAVVQKQFEYELPRLIEDKTNRHIQMKWGNFYLPATTPTEKVVYAQAKLEAMRAAYGHNLKEKFWEPVVVEAEEAVKHTMLNVAYAHSIDEKQKAALLDELIADNGALCIRALDTWARDNQWTTSSPVVKTSSAWGVTLTTNPREAEIRIMHLIQYIVAKREGRNPEALMDVVPNGSQIVWSGTHYVLGIFSDGQKFGPQKYALKQDGTLTIQPDGVTFTPLAVPK